MEEREYSPRIKPRAEAEDAEGSTAMESTMAMQITARPRAFLRILAPTYARCLLIAIAIQSNRDSKQSCRSSALLKGTTKRPRAAAFWRLPAGPDRKDTSHSHTEYAEEVTSSLAPARLPANSECFPVIMLASQARPHAPTRGAPAVCGWPATCHHPDLLALPRPASPSSPWRGFRQ